jgi:hypothetical protein
MKAIENLIGMDCNFLGPAISSIGGRPARISRNQAMQAGNDFRRLWFRPIIWVFRKGANSSREPLSGAERVRVASCDSCQRECREFRSFHVGLGAVGGHSLRDGI